MHENAVIASLISIWHNLVNPLTSVELKGYKYNWSQTLIFLRLSLKDTLTYSPSSLLKCFLFQALSQI